MSFLESFFRQYLVQVRGVSPHTLRAYRDAVRLLLEFVCRRCRSSVDRVELDDLTCERVREFLEHLGAERKNSTPTRNARLAAIRCFVRHLLRCDPTRANQYSRILALPSRRNRQKTVSYLEPEQVRCLLKAVPMDEASGLRNLILLLFLYNTGARIGEALQMRWNDLRLERPWHVLLHGKGRKDRVCPLWSQTVALLRQLRERCGQLQDGHVFLNARGEPLGRDGAAYLLRRSYQLARNKHPGLPVFRVHPHALRHSCAVALLQAGVDLTSIRDYLGHCSISTTSRYLQTDLAAKEKTLKRFWERAGITHDRQPEWSPSRGVLEFLNSL